MKVYKYNSNRVLEHSIECSDIPKDLKHSLECIIHKNYVYQDGCFFSYFNESDVKFLSIEEEKAMYDAYLSKNYNALISKYSKSGANIDDTLDSINAAILENYSKIYSSIGINRLDCLHIPKNKNIQRNVVSYSKECETYKGIESRPDESDPEICTLEVNRLKLYDVIKFCLLSAFDSKIVDFYVEYHQHRGKRGANFIREQSKALRIGRNTLYETIKRMDIHLNESKVEILKDYDMFKYPLNNEITLWNMIFD